MLYNYSNIKQREPHSVRYSLEQVEVDNRDSLTSELQLPSGDVLELTRQDLVDLIRNMDDNARKES